MKDRVFKPFGWLITTKQTTQISKAPYSPIAGPASPHAGVSVWFLLGGLGRLRRTLDMA
jgi:hypothetical protein